MTTYTGRIPRSAAEQMDATPSGACTPIDCHASFRVIAQQLDTIGDGIDSIVGQVKDLDARITAIGERMAAQETSTVALWHEVRDMGKRLNAVPALTDEKVSAHAKDCDGREYVRERLRQRGSSSTIPRRQNDEQTQPRIDLHVDKPSAGGGFNIPSWVIYVAIVVGIATAVAGFTAGKLAQDGIKALPAMIEQVSE